MLGILADTLMIATCLHPVSASRQGGEPQPGAGRECRQEPPVPDAAWRRWFGRLR